MTLSCVIVTCSALTDTELSSFYNGVAVEIGEKYYRIQSNGIPDHDYGMFRDDVTRKDLNFFVPIRPSLSASPGCLNTGAIAVAINGVPIYNPLTADGRDAVLTGTFDDCNGHASNDGAYHYHGLPKCLGEYGSVH